MPRRSGFLRARNVVALSAMVALVAACGFGVDLDGIFGGAGVGPGDGDGSVDGANDGAATDATIPKVQVVQIGVGDDFACGRRADGTVMCWGSGTLGQLGDNLDTHASRPVLVKDLNDAIELSVGDDHACAVRKDATVVCWGQNDLRQLGDGTQNDALIPRAVVNLTGVAKVAAAGDFTCALKTDGTVQCWGDNGSGQLGDNTTAFHATAAPVPGLTDVTQLAVSFEAVCALNKGGEVYCWGDNFEGLTGIGTSGNGLNTLVPTKVPDLVGVASLGNGPSAYHFCAVLTDGGARCWGDANSGQIGNAQGGEMQTKPQPVVGLVDAASIAMGESFTCALRKSGEVSCWGTNAWRQLGQGDGTQPGGTNSPVAVAGLTGVQQISSGPRHSCALHTGGERISCWGGNLAGALGRDTRLASDVPLKVAGITGAANVGLGRNHSCVTTTTGDIWCWGMNEFRQQASSAFMVTGTPTKITAIGGAQKIIGGEIHTCGLFGTEVKCWGHGSEGALGNGGTPYLQADPVVFNSGPATAINAGYHFTCALLANKQVACAGNNDEGRIGSAGGNATTPRIVQVANPAAADAGDDADPDAGDAGPPPPATIAFDNVDRIGVGRLHTCAVHAGGKVSCWGTPWDGRLGINTNTARTNPVAVNGLTPGATEIAAGFEHSCAVLSDGSVRCWGANTAGQVSGGGGNGAQLRTPNLNGKTAKAISAGSAHTCIIQNDDTVACWGRGREGQLGQGVRVDTNQPVAVMGLTGVTSLDAEEDRTCAVTNDGSVYCWGDNSTGALGDGAVMQTGVPGSIAGY
jgi:alpha-tubulin suppressor-like RCC1 family protein